MGTMKQLRELLGTTASDEPLDRSQNVGRFQVTLDTMVCQSVEGLDHVHVEAGRSFPQGQCALAIEAGDIIDIHGLTLHE